MPTYEYTCTACGEHLEVVQSFRDEPLTVCPACGGKLRKVFGSIGVVFKGRGFYKTDSRPVASSGASGADSKSTEKSASPATSGGDSSAGGASSASSDSAKEKKQSGPASPTGKSAAAS